MKPLELILQGFASFRHKTIIPFEDLAEQRLFAISGVTGSGKSSILDAISYVLYGRTPRLGSMGLDEALLSQGADKIFVSLIFESHALPYRATRSIEWRIGRDGQSKKGSTEVRIEQGTYHEDGSLQWKHLPESDKVRSAYKKIEAIVGLDYDGFTRAILLPQGAFSEFLRGEASQRRSLLMKLLGAERISEMQKLARQRANDAQKELSFIQQRLEQLSHATPKQQKELHQRIDVIEENLATGTTTLEHHHKTLETMATLREFIKEKAELEKKHSQLEAQDEAMTTLSQQLEQAHSAATLKPQQQRLAEWQERTQKFAQQLQHYTRSAQQASAALEQLQQQNETMAEKKQELEHKGQQIHALQQLQGQLEQLQREAGDLQLLQETITTAESFDADALDNLKRLSYQLPSLQKSQQAVETSTAKLEQVRATLEPQQAAINQAQEKVGNLREQALQAHEKLQGLQEALEQAQEAADREVHVMALREGLELGDPCPFCGEPLNSLPEIGDNQLASLKKSRKAQEKAVDTAKKAFNEAREHYTSLVSSYQRDKDYCSELETRWQENQVTLAENRQVFTEIAPETATFAEITATIEQKMRQQWQALAAQIQEQARAVALELELIHDVKALSTLEKSVKNLQKSIEAHQKALQAAENTYNLAQRDVENMQKQHSEAQEQQQEAQENFHNALASAAFADEATWQAALMSDKALQKAQKELENYRDAYRQVQHRLELVSSHLHSAHINENENESESADAYEKRYQQIVQEKRQLEQELQQQREDKGSLSAQLEQLAKDLAEKEARGKDASKLEQRYSTFEQLNKDLQQKNFQEFIIGRMQQDLAQRAGMLMHDITTGRYRLHFNPSNGNYSVADAWNGGEARDVRTLSGGETFIASLALALALSDSASNRSLGALFLDEGFGTLDAQTLESVIQVLENLSQQGRMVGVITHVQELTERLPVRLQVSKSENGSKVWLDRG